MNLQARLASMADIGELTRLFDEYRVFYEQPSDPGLARSFLTERIERDQSKIFFAVTDDDHGCGFTQLYPSFSSVSAKRVWILNDLYVEMAARREGVAKLLMNKARDFALETSAKGIQLETAMTNTGAQALYDSLGYSKNTEFFSYSLDLT